MRDATEGGRGGNDGKKVREEEEKTRCEARQMKMDKAAIEERQRERGSEGQRERTSKRQKAVRSKAMRENDWVRSLAA